MKVLSAFHIRGRGPVAVVTLAEPLPMGPAPDYLIQGSRALRRLSDGAVWVVHGYERYQTLVPKCGRGDSVGLLLGSGARIDEGDEVEFMEMSQ